MLHLMKEEEEEESKLFERAIYEYKYVCEGKKL